jgi:hypothetical protein
MKKPEDRSQFSVVSRQSRVLRTPRSPPAGAHIFEVVAPALRAGEVVAPALRAGSLSIQRSTLHAPRSTISDARGVALVLTLGILAIVTLLLIAFVTSMRVENMASKNFNDLIKARQLAQAAVDEAVATIRAATPVITNNPSYPSSFVTYFTSPGLIITSCVGCVNAWSNAALYSAIDPNPLIQDPQIDLNAGNWITGTNCSYSPPCDCFTPGKPGHHTPINAGWIPVLPINNGPILGRFAYWVDDESAKVNINVAGTRGNDLEGRTPAAIDLLALFYANPPSYNDQVDITNFTAVLPFDTLESIKAVTNFGTLTGFHNGINQDKYYTNQFYMTVNSTSPDLTPWGTKRPNLTQIVATNTTTNAVGAIVATLSDPSLSTWFGQTFSNKYNPPYGVYQIAASIIDYINTNTVPTDSGDDPPHYLGLEQTPYLNELVISNAVTVAPQPTGTPGKPIISFGGNFIAELWYMYTNTFGWPLPPGGAKVVIDSVVGNTPTISLINATRTFLNLQYPVTIQLTSPFPNPMLPNSYACVSTPASYIPPFIIQVNDTNRPTTVQLSGGTLKATFSSAQGRIDYALIPFFAQTVTFSPPYSSPATSNINWGSACNDPRVKPVSNNWTPVDAGLGLNTNTLGGPNWPVLSWATVSTGISPDGDTSCHIISGNIISGNPGTVRDRWNMYPGELAFIHTGLPWRTFRLQHQAATEPNPPDWVVLDLFSATDTTNVIGRININAAIINSNADSALPPPRVRPLMALLTNNVPGYPTYVRALASTNIYYFGNIWTNNIDLPALQAKLPALSGLPAFAFAGEICEVPGLAPSAPKSIAETPVRGIANLITTRSNTFSIWAIAQSIKKVDKNQPGIFIPGTDIITGEVKVQAIVERYQDPSTTPPTVRFRTKYFRYYYQ